MMSDEYPKFSLENSRFDQSTYYGRLRRCFNVVDPSTLIVSSEKLANSLELLEKFKTGNLPEGVTDRELWEARKLKEAIIHPDTGEKILMPLRMSGFVPFGTISVIGMLIPGASTAQVIFWQWLNQSHNACVNYANRNATKPTPTERFVMSYIGAVTSAVGIAVGLSLAIKKLPVAAASKLYLSRFVAYPATSAANICNIYLMRQNELREGVDVTDESGNVIGTSLVAAKKAVFETALSRIVLSAPVLLTPPIIMKYLEKTKFLKGNPVRTLMVNAVVITAAFGIALPCTIALFPQTSKMDKSKVELELQEKVKGEAVFFNKGL